jgi:dephospho-CoA kinase
MDRARMRELVFSDAGAKARLEAILHPRIRDAALAAGEAATGADLRRAAAGRIGHLAPAREPHRHGGLSGGVQIARVMARNNLPKSKCGHHGGQASRLQGWRADDVIVNNGRSLLWRRKSTVCTRYIWHFRRKRNKPAQRL